MWVRNQNKTRLVETKSFEIEREGKINKDGIWESLNAFRIRDDEGFVIAVYSSKEKAMKVLDWIQIHLLDLENAKYNEMNNVVFQMPQDDEVE